jgi:hypothetical protein
VVSTDYDRILSIDKNMSENVEEIRKCMPHPRSLLTPEEVRRNRNEALLGQLVAFLADIGVHTEQLL